MSREVTNDLTVLERLVPVSGRDVVDIGCGPGALVRALAARGARMTGVEISESQLAAAIRDDDGAGARYVVGLAERLPLEDASVDVVLFMRSLHHVPPADMLDGLREAARVLRPGGAVYIAEPLAEGDFFELTSLVEDEREVRAAAQRVIADAAVAGLDRAETVEYDVRLCLADLDAFAARLISVDPTRGEVFEERKALMAEAFARLGEPGERPGERCFLVPMRVDVLRAAGAPR
ncbi:MAG TPA: class I SAM-dependent methyltransferase [Solirubrobacteraceae bacterium]|nr:class I SAM-dependent methyltransferase [Solirubrobacteraceae bacterium]